MRPGPERWAVVSLFQFSMEIFSRLTYAHSSFRRADPGTPRWCPRWICENVVGLQLLSMSQKNKFKLVSWQTDLCSAELGRKKLADGWSMYAVMRRRPSALKSRSISILELDVTTSSILLALLDNVLRYCPSRKIRRRAAREAARFLTCRKTERHVGRVVSSSTA